MAKRKRKAGLIEAIINSVADAVKEALVLIPGFTGGALAAGAGADPTVAVGIAAAGVSGLRRLGDELKNRALDERVKALQELGSLSPADIEARLQEAGLRIAELRDGLTRLLLNVAEVSAEQIDRVSELAARLEEHLNDHLPTRVADVPGLFVKAASLWIEADSVQVKARKAVFYVEEAVAARPRPGSRWYVPIPKNPNFFGREADMKRVHDAIEGSRTRGEVVNVVGATGIGGIGKSQLAAEYAHLYRDQYPGGAYWVDAGSEDLTSEFYKLGPFIGVRMPEQPTPEAIQAVVIQVMSHLGSNEPTLLILDNLKDPNILQGWRLGEAGWLPACDECRVLATSRRTDLPNTTKLDIDKLGPEPAHDLLTASRKPIGAPDKEAAERICRQVDYLPLALEIAAAYIAEYKSVTFEGFSERLEAEGALDTLDDASKGEIGVRAVLTEMTSKVEGDALKLLLAVGCFAAVSMDPSMLAAVAQLETEGKRGRPAPFETAANALVATSLLKREPKPGRLVSHTLVHEFARSKLGTKAQQEGAASRLFRVVGALLNAHETVTMIGALLREEPHFESAFGLALSAEEWRWASNIANGLGEFHHETARYDTALLWLRRALEMDEKAFGPDHPTVAIRVNNVGSVLRDQGDYAGALEALRRALEIDEKAFGPDHPTVAITVNNIGLVLHDLGDYEGALEAYRRALKIDEKAFGPEHPNVARDVNNIGGVLHDQGDYEGALVAFRRALEIDEKVFGADHPKVAIRVNNIGLVLRAQGDYKGALEAYRRALQIDEKAFGPDHPKVAISVNNLGRILHDQGDYEGALEAFTRALEIDGKVFGPDHPNVATIVNNIGSVLKAQGDYKRALEAYRRALEIDEKAFGPDHPTVATDVNNIGSVLEAQGDYKGALEAYRRALKIDEKAFGPDHPNVPIRVNNIGSVLKAQGDYEGALEAFGRALEIDEKALGPDHPNVAIRANNIGSLLVETGKPDEARPYFWRAYRIFKAKLGPNHPNTKTTAGWLRSIGADPDKECGETEVRG